MKTVWIIENGFLNGEGYSFQSENYKEQFKTHGVNAKIIRSTEYLFIYENGEAFLTLNQNKVENPGAVLFLDKDVLSAKAFEMNGVRVFNSSDAILLCDNKALTYQKLCSSHIKMPITIFAPKTFDTVGYNNLEFLVNAEKTLGYPMIIKEFFGSFGGQVYLAKDRKEATNIIAKIGEKEFLMQKFIKTSVGKDIRVNVVGGKVVTAIKRYSENDFRSNVALGGKAEKFELTQAQEEQALDATKALDLDFAGVDLLFDEDDESGKTMVCEVNSNPHIRGTISATGINVAKHIAEYIIGEII